MSFPSHWSERWGSSSLISFVMKSGPLHINQGASVSWRFKEETDWQKNSGWETLTWGRIHWGSTLEQVKHFLYTMSLNLSNTPSAAYFHYLHLRSRNNCCNYLINVLHSVLTNRRGHVTFCHLADHLKLLTWCGWCLSRGIIHWFKKCLRSLKKSLL